MPSDTERRAPTPQQTALIERIVARLQDEPGVEAAWLSGSLGKGIGDAWSDVDVLVLTADGQAGAVSESISQDLSAIATPVLVNRLFGGRVLNVVTVDWARFDLSFAEGGELGFHDGAALTPLFNHGDRAPAARPIAPYATSPDTLRKIVDEFLRVMGLMPVSVGRRDWVLMLAGADLLRGMTVELMLEENGVSPAARGGMMRRHASLTAEQRDALEALPPLVATREAAIAANMALAQLFLPRARRLAAGIGMAWPEAFEAATRRHLKRTLDVDLS